MQNKSLRWALYCLLPLALLILPFAAPLNWKGYFKTFVLNPQKTGIMTLNYHDETRNRPLVTEVWYPVDEQVSCQNPPGLWIRCSEARGAPISSKEQRYPLIIMSHGSGGDRYNISWLAEVFASNGYIVVAMDHYGNTWNNKIPELYIQPWERPKDISFVLDKILSESPFKDRIDVQRIGFTGYSLGGATGMWIAGARATNLNLDMVRAHSSQELGGIVSPELIDTIDYTPATASYRDPRISAVVVMAPALGWMFAESSLEQIDIPILIVAPEKDAVVPTEKNARRFAKTVGKASLHILSGEATHYVFLNCATAMGKRILDTRYSEDPPSVDRKKIHDFVAKRSLEFFDKNLE